MVRTDRLQWRQISLLLWPILRQSRQPHLLQAPASWAATSPSVSSGFAVAVAIVISTLLPSPSMQFSGRALSRPNRCASILAQMVRSFLAGDVDDPVAYVLSLNLHRRHLSPSQLSMVAGRARKIYDEQAQQRMKEGSKHGAEKRSGTPMVNLPEGSTSRDAAGRAVGVSGKSVDYATRVLAKAVPEVIAAVDEGRMAVSTALKPLS